ncbi:MAG: YfjI family protein [Alphaproteobacteria bacterium]
MPPDGAERMRDAFEEAEEVRPEPPRPLTRDTPPADPFPIDALGDVLASAARAIYDRVQAPLAMCGQSVIAVAALATQGHANVVLPIGRDGQARPLSCYFVSVAPTGERKSACDREAMWPVARREMALREEYDRAAPDYLNDKLAWEKARDGAVKKCKGDRASIKAELDKIGPAPNPPLPPLLTCPEPTFEGLCKLFAIGQPSLGIFAAEGGQFIGGHGMNDDAKLRTAAGLSDVWDGSPIRRVRSGDGVSVLAGRRLSAHLMAQPAVANILFRDRLLAEQGLLSRLLVTAPDPASGMRLWHNERPETELELRRYGARMLSIFDRPLPLRPGMTNELEPRSIVLSASARQAWIEFADHVELEIAPNGGLDAIRGLANKLPEHAARLAAVLTLVREINAEEVDEREIAAGIALAEHYAIEALRLFGCAQVKSDLRLAQSLLDWLLGTWTGDFISLPDIYQRSLNAIGDKATAARLVAILEDHGWLIRMPAGAVVSGQHRRDAWRIVRG